MLAEAEEIGDGTAMSSALAQAAGQLIIGGFDGHAPPADVEALVREGVLGGVILFKRNLGTLAETAALVERLAAWAPAAHPLWMAIDQEGGRVQRLGPPFPQLPAMRTVTDPELAEVYGQTLGEALSALGFNQDYAPVLDVDTNPANPVIGDRSFSRDPEVVAELGLALARGLERAGVAACGKHFPGHGDTSTDSHLELPRLDHDLARLEAVELVPFRAAARAGIATIMTAHVLFPALDPHHPATLSEHVLRPLLRDRLGYKGVIVSDDLEMKAVADHYGIEDSAVRAIRAGCDQLLVCHQPGLAARAHAAIVAAVEHGALTAERVFEASARVAALKAKFPRRAGLDAIRARMGWV
jgi:beta-N-acetylhexosaminidase